MKFEEEKSLQKLTIDVHNFQVDQLSEAYAEIFQGLILNDHLEISLTHMEGEYGYLDYSAQDFC